MAKVLLYDPSDINVPNRVLQYLLSANEPDYFDNPNALINPDVSSLNGVPVQYWKFDNGNIIEMPQNEKDIIDIPNSPTYSYSERVEEINTNSSDFTYHQHNFTAPSDGLYKVSFALEYRYSASGWQYIRHKVDVDDSILITDPSGDGWLRPRLYVLSTGSAGLGPVSGFRTINLTAGNHTIHVRIGDESTGSVIGSFACVEVELK